MAAAASRSRNSGIFWMNEASDEEQPLAFVPGVDGDFEPGSTSLSSKRDAKIGTRRSCVYKNKATVKKTSKTHVPLQTGRSEVNTKEKGVQHIATGAKDHIPSPALETFLPLSQVVSEVSRTKAQVCLKDLCAEDKRRIANLIEELARVSEEKEESMQRLKDEQEKFDCKIQQLEQQNVIIAQERESLQQQYKECQELLRLYQQYLSQQQAKLNQSIAQLTNVPVHSKVLGSEETPGRTAEHKNRKIDGSLFDGSYLSLDATRAQQLQVSRSTDGGRGAVQSSGNPVSLSCASEFCLVHGQTELHRSQTKVSCHRCERHQVNNSVCGTPQWRSCNGSHLKNGHHDTSNKHKCERIQSMNAMGLKSEETLTKPQLGPEDWEEKRHQLLLQKMQLEMERERLQVRLIEQEERLNRQHQQLQQTHLDYNRFQQATQPELNNSNTRTRDPQLQGPSHQDLPSSVHEDAGLKPADQHLLEKCSQPAPTPRDGGIHTHDVLERSRRDMATSPTKSPVSLSKPTSVSTVQEIPDASSRTVSVPPQPPPFLPKLYLYPSILLVIDCDRRLDFSVVEVLDMLSPVYAPEQNQLSTGRTKTTQHKKTLITPKSVARTLLNPSRSYPQSSQLDLEESQILEDIFFIC